VGELDWDPDLYGTDIRAEIAHFDKLQDAVAEATRGLAVRTVLELGVGTGETARRVLALHPHAAWVAVDSSVAMLGRARETLADADLRLARIEDPLPEGRFDLVLSALAVHHLSGPGKQDLFRRVAAVLEPVGCFVLGDLVVPRRAEEADVPVDRIFDLPDSAEDQLEWLRDAGLDARIAWSQRDLAVLVARAQP